MNLNLLFILFFFIIYLFIFINIIQNRIYSFHSNWEVISSNHTLLSEWLISSLLYIYFCACFVYFYWRLFSFLFGRWHWWHFFLTYVRCTNYSKEWVVQLLYMKKLFMKVVLGKKDLFSALHINSWKTPQTTLFWQ